jgi:hypothetical protein
VSTRRGDWERGCSGCCRQELGRVRATVILDSEKYSPIQLDPHMKETLPTSPDPDEGSSEPKGQ